MKQMIKKLAIVLSVALVCAPMGAMAANKLIVKDSTGAIDQMVVTDTGYIGVGTNAPYSSLHMIGSTNAAAQVLTGTNYTGNGGGGSFIGIHNNAGGALPISGDRLGYFYFGSKTATSYILGGGMAVYAEGPWSAVSWPTAFRFETAPVNPNSTTTGYGRLERMRITSTGNVGIGTIVPNQRLEVNGGIRLNTTDTKPACSITTRGTLWFQQGLTDTLYVCSYTSGAPSWKIVTLN